MNKYVFLFILSSFCFLSCKKSTQNTNHEIKKSDKNIVVKHKTPPKVNNASLKKIEPWKEYTNFKEFIKRFENISPSEAFDNTNELKELTIALEDSLNIPLFKSHSFKSRLHVLNNEVLRLDDMSNISAITSKQVNAQIDKIFLVVGSLNDKINTAFDQEKYEKQINLDDFFTAHKEEHESKKATKKDITTKQKKKKN